MACKTGKMVVMIRGDAILIHEEFQCLWDEERESGIQNRRRLTKSIFFLLKICRKQENKLRKLS